MTTLETIGAWLASGLVLVALAGVVAASVAFAIAHGEDE